MQPYQNTTRLSTIRLAFLSVIVLWACALAAAFLFFPRQASAAVLYQSNTDETEIARYDRIDIQDACLIFTGVEGTLESAVHKGISREGLTGTLEADLYLWDGTAPTGGSLAHVDGVTIPGDTVMEDVTFTFDTPYLLDVSETYCLRLTGTNVGSVTGYVRLGGLETTEPSDWLWDGLSWSDVDHQTNLLLNGIPSGSSTSIPTSTSVTTTIITVSWPTGELFLLFLVWAAAFMVT